jgi:mediator of RNA polymerase II transcription subunit 18
LYALDLGLRWELQAESQIRDTVSVLAHLTLAMTSHSYEIALYGKFLKGDLKPILNRVALHSESAHQMHSREVIFDPPDAALQREANQEPALLRAAKELLEADAKW